MDEAKEVAIQNIVDREIKHFADSYETGFTNEVDGPDGFEIVFAQYEKSSTYIREALERIKTLFLNKIG